MILSFGWTSQYLPYSGPKDTTRRIWKPRTLAIWQKAWDERPQFDHTAVDKSLAYGGKRIGTFTLQERPFLQRLADMPAEDLIREGGMVDSVDAFIDKYFCGDRDLEVAVVRFTFCPYPMIHAADLNLPVGTQVEIMPPATQYPELQHPERVTLTGRVGTIVAMHDDPGYHIVRRYTLALGDRQTNVAFYEVAPIKTLDISTFQPTEAIMRT